MKINTKVFQEERRVSDDAKSASTASLHGVNEWMAVRFHESKTYGIMTLAGAQSMPQGLRIIAAFRGGERVNVQ